MDEWVTQLDATQCLYMDQVVATARTHLQAEINWYQLFHELIQDFDLKVLEKRQKAALKKAKVPEAA